MQSLNMYLRQTPMCCPSVACSLAKVWPLQGSAGDRQFDQYLGQLVRSLLSVASQKGTRDRILVERLAFYICCLVPDHVLAVDEFYLCMGFYFSSPS